MPHPTLPTSPEPTEGDLGHLGHHSELHERFNFSVEVRSGTTAARPLASAVEEGTLYWDTDAETLHRSNGVTWDNLSAGATDHGALTGLADDDHPQYALDTDLTTHEGAADPHPGYVLNAELTSHEGAADPHTGYRLESADHSHQSTGAQAGKIDHGAALDGLADDDHTQYHNAARHAAVDAADHASGAAADGTVLTADGAGGAAWEAPAAGGPTYVYKTADESTSSSTLQDDDHLSFTVDAGGIYVIEVGFIFTTAMSTEHAKIDWVEPSGAWNFSYANSRQDVATGDQSGHWEGGGSRTITIGNGSSGSTVLAMGSGVLIVGVTGGTFKLQWSSLNGNSVTHEKGSWLSYKKLN